MKKIKITDINTLKNENPLYILVAGAIGAGKSTIVSSYLNNFEVVDPDIYTTHLGNGVYNLKHVAQSMAMVKETVNHFLDKKASFVQQGTSANIKSTINKMIKAKEKGFTTILLYVDTDKYQCVTNVLNRNDRNEIPKEKILRTYMGSNLTYKLMSADTSKTDIYIDNALTQLNTTIKDIQSSVDYTVHYENFL